MTIPAESYLDQKKRWPASGRHILAGFDEETILVYQAYSPATASFAVTHGRFGGGGFSYNRMSWIKPNFLWMMYRSDWARSLGQETVLGIRLRKSFFDSLLESAVPSSFDAGSFATHAEWKSAVAESEVRLQWDPDHAPNGDKEERKAIQLGLRGATLESYGKREIVEIIDMTEFVRSQRVNSVRERYAELITPSERVYRPGDRAAARIGLSVDS
jgi:hypothetical protein